MYLIYKWHFHQEGNTQDLCPYVSVIFSESKVSMYIGLKPVEVLENESSA